MIKAICSLFGSILLFKISYLLAIGHPDIICLFEDPVNEIVTFVICIASGITLAVSGFDDIKNYWKS